jgi:hypothetical protein
MIAVAVDIGGAVADVVVPGGGGMEIFITVP